MESEPRALVLHEFPPETTGTVEEFIKEVQCRLPNINLKKASSYQDALDQISDADVIIEHGITDEQLAEADRAKWIQTLSSGANSYNFELLERSGAILTTVSGVHARPIAEHVFALMLFFERGLDRSRRQQLRREWNRFSTGELGRKTLGIIGIGSVGGRVAELGSAFGMDTIGLRRCPSKDHSAIDDMIGPERRHELLTKSDYVVIACPLTDETRNLIGPNEFSSMKSDSVLVNIARGEIIDQEALITQLQTGYIGGAALDVAEIEPLPQESPLWNMSNVIITPHMAGASPNFPERCAEIFAQNYRSFVEGSTDEMQNRVEF
jgi:phosphoglycerate dehydrogenase-like enzyme